MVMDPPAACSKPATVVAPRPKFIAVPLRHEERANFETFIPDLPERHLRPPGPMRERPETMSDSETGQQPTQKPDGQGGGLQDSLLTVHTQYVRDLSFENPNAPQVYAQMKTSPKVDLRIEMPMRAVQERLHELGLKLTLNATLEGQTCFIIELDYAGLMTVGNHVPQEEIEAVLAIDGARLLFPFARRVISDVVRDGGFPPVMIGGLDFAKLYHQRRQQQAGGATETTPAVTPPGSTA